MSAIRIWRLCHVTMVFTTHFFEVVVDVKTSGLPNTSKLWLVKNNGMLRLTPFAATNPLQHLNFMDLSGGESDPVPIVGDRNGMKASDPACIICIVLTLWLISPPSTGDLHRRVETLLFSTEKVQALK